VPHRVQHGAAVPTRGRYVEQDDFVGSIASMSRSAFRRIAGIAQILKLDSFHDASSVHIEAGDDAFG
jgi:hypothetical protein